MADRCKVVVVEDDLLGAVPRAKEVSREQGHDGRRAQQLERLNGRELGGVGEGPCVGKPSDARR